MTEIPKSAETIEPVRKVLEVPCDPVTAMDVFTLKMGNWWPLASHTLGADRARSVQVEPRQGGRVFEITRDGEEHLWGTVTKWDPPQGLSFTWHPGREPELGQYVEVGFTEALGKTRVELVHSGWETLGHAAMEMRRGYEMGWDPVLAGYVEACS